MQHLQGDGARHQDVVVMPGHRLKAALARQLVGAHLVDGAMTTLDILSLAHGGNERIDGLSLGLAVGVETKLAVSLAVA